MRVDYYDALQDRYGEAHTKPLADWAADHRISLISNPLVEESLGDHKLIEGGDWFEMSRHYQIPGMDLISGLNVDAVTPKLNSSVAHAFDRGRNLAESFGAFGWDLTLEEMKRGIAWEAASGVDLTDNHAFYYSIEGQRAFESQPSEFFQNLFWPHFRSYADTVGRLNGPARGSTPVNPVGLLYPSTTILAEGTPFSNRGFFGNGPELGPIDQSWQATSTALLRGQLDFDYVNERQLAGDPDLGAPIRARGAELAVHENRYRTLVWPRTTTLQLEALDEIEKFVRDGGTLIAVEALPTREADGRDAALRERLRALFGTDPAAPQASSNAFGDGRAVFRPDRAGIADAVRSLEEPDVVLSPATGDVRARHVRRGPEDAYLLTNTAGRLVRTEADLDHDGVPELWQPESGRAARADVYRSEGGRTVVPLALEPYESVWVVFRPGGGNPAHVTASNAAIESVALDGGDVTVRAVARRPGPHYVAARHAGRAFGGEFEVADQLEPMALDGDWDLRFERDGAQTVRRPLGSWTDLDPRFSGRGRYTKRFDVPASFLAEGRRIQLELGQVDEIAEVRVNGRDAGERVWAPYRLDVTDALRAGENTLEVVVTNTQANSIEGRAISSGLIGPVALRPERVVDLRLERDAAVEGLEASVAPESSTAVPGSAQELAVTLDGYAEGDLTGTLSAAPPAGWTVEPSSQPFTLHSGGRPASEELTVRVSVPAKRRRGRLRDPADRGDRKRAARHRHGQDPRRAGDPRVGVRDRRRRRGLAGDEPARAADGQRRRAAYALDRRRPVHGPQRHVDRRYGAAGGRDHDGDLDGRRRAGVLGDAERRLRRGAQHEVHGRLRRGAGLPRPDTGPGRAHHRAPARPADVAGRHPHRLDPGVPMRRRALLTAAALLAAALAAPAAAQAKDWKAYVLAPTSRDVAPVRVVSAAPGGGVIERPRPRCARTGARSSCARRSPAATRASCSTSAARSAATSRPTSAAPARTPCSRSASRWRTCATSATRSAPRASSPTTTGRSRSASAASSPRTSTRRRAPRRGATRSCAAACAT